MKANEEVTTEQKCLLVTLLNQICQAIFSFAGLFSMFGKEAENWT